MNVVDPRVFFMSSNAARRVALRSHFSPLIEPDSVDDETEDDRRTRDSECRDDEQPPSSLPLMLSFARLEARGALVPPSAPASAGRLVVLVGVELLRRPQPTTAMKPAEQREGEQRLACVFSEAAWLLIAQRGGCTGAAPALRQYYFTSRIRNSSAGFPLVAESCSRGSLARLFGGFHTRSAAGTPNRGQRATTIPTSDLRNLRAPRPPRGPALPAHRPALPEQDEPVPCRRLPASAFGETTNERPPMPGSRSTAPAAPGSGSKRAAHRGDEAGAVSGRWSASPR